VLERRETGDDGRCDEVLKVHTEPGCLEIESAFCPANLHTAFVAPRRLRLEHALVFGEREVERRRLERIAVVAEQLEMIDPALPGGEDHARAASRPRVRRR